MAWARNRETFDGFVPGKEFQECKGPSYNQFLDPKEPGHFKWWFEASQIRKKMVPQAIQQLRAAAGRFPVRWYVAEPEAAGAIRKLLRENGAKGVEVIYQPLLSK